MDFSKLPKLSETKPDAVIDPPPQPQPIAYGRERVSVGAEIWISFLVGALFIYLGDRPLEYLFTRAHPENFTWTFNDANGNPLPYLQTVFFLPDIGICALGFILLIDGLQMLLARSERFGIAAFVLTTAGTLLNVAAFAISMGNGSGFQLITFLAIILGGYTAIYQLNAVRALRLERQFSTDR